MQGTQEGRVVEEGASSLWRPRAQDQGMEGAVWYCGLCDVLVCLSLRGCESEQV